MKTTYSTYQEALEVCKKGFSCNAPLWIYEAEGGFQITSKGFYFKKAPDYLIDFGEFSKLKPYDFLYEDESAVAGKSTIRVGVDVRGSLWQLDHVAPLRTVRDFFFSNDAYLVLTFEYYYKSEAANLINIYLKYLIDNKPENIVVRYKFLNNKSVLFAKGENNIASLERELRNVWLFYKLLSDENTIINVPGSYLDA